MKYRYILIGLLLLSACASKTVLKSGRVYYWGVAVAGNTSYITEMKSAPCQYVEDSSSMIDDLEGPFKAKYAGGKLEGQPVNRAYVLSNSWSRESAEKQYAETRNRSAKVISF